MTKPHWLFILSALVVIWPHMAESTCPDLCQCDYDRLIVTCIKAGLEVLPNTLHPNLKTMIFKYNEFPTIYFGLSFLPQLVKVDLSHNKIVTISNKAFGSNRDLRQLKLEGNKISQISNQTLFGLTNLEVFSLKGNLVESLSEGLFAFSPKLQEVDFARNRIAQIHSQAFRGLHSLEILHLEDNNLNSIPTSAFEQIPNLAEVYLSGNPIKTISSRAFQPFHRLSVLDLSSSRLRVIDDEAFRGLGTLKTLKLEDNHLISVPTQIFQDVPNLDALDIGRNAFNVILNGAFKFLSKLKKLDISGCRSLTSIESGAFVNCVDLERVTLTLNRALTDISEFAFDAVPNLKLLSLADNGLQTIPENLVPWHNLRSLDLSGNPWRCDCDLLFLSEAVAILTEQKNFINNNSTSEVNFFISDGKCAWPSSLKGQWVSQLKNEILPCSHDDNGQNSVLLSQEPQEVARNNIEQSRSQKSAFHSVIIYVCVGVLTFVVVLVLLIFAVRWRHKFQDWMQKTLFKDSRIKQSHYQPHIPHHHQPYSSPYLRPQTASTSYEYGCDDEHYYYVPTMQNRLGAGKAIPVTEL